MRTDWLRAATAVGGETGVLAQTYDWSRSRLGPTDAWPDGLRATGQAAWVVDQPLVMNRSGFVEGTTFTSSYGPLRDRDGTVRGMLAIAYETTSAPTGPA